MKTDEMTRLRIAEEITELVGETPVLHLRKVVPPEAADVYAKLEYLNPGGSIKDRAALGMILRAEREGLLSPGATIFEATAGNTGLGLALVASVAALHGGTARLANHPDGGAVATLALPRLPAEAAA
jgi:cysteine synthase A